MMKIARLRHPIVLIHGLLGFNRLRMGKMVLADYFPGISTALREAGNRVVQAQLSPTAGIAERAAQLKELLDQESPEEPVHLFGHSLGGLDARYVISRLNMGSRVLSLTTIGTPHRGTSFADWGTQYLAELVRPVLQFLGLPYQAFYDLTTTSCQRFNEEVPDVASVRYFSVAGQFQCRWSTPEWRLPSHILSRKEGPNDGMVSVASATYGENCEVWDANHLNLVNWQRPLTRPQNRVPDYARLVGRLADARM